MATANAFRAIVGATAVVVALVPSPAAAEPRQPGQADNFRSCVLGAWDKNPTMSSAKKQQVAEDCCLNAGGTFNEVTHICYLGANNATVAVPVPPAPAPPRATIAPPPGATNKN